MTAEPATDPVPPAPASSASASAAPASPAAAQPVIAGARPGHGAPPALVYGLVALSLGALVTSGLLWQKLSGIQEQLARQSADAGSNAVEARTLARQARELASETATRQAVLESRVADVALQRTQIEELMQSLSRSRDENLVLDVEAALRLAQQQSQLTLSVEPLLAALRTADQRLALSGQPRLARVRAAIARDIERIRSAGVADVPALLQKFDDLIRVVDELPVQNEVPVARAGTLRAPSASASPLWWERVLGAVVNEARNLLRVSRIDQPEAALLAPEQGFFLRENLKLKLLNARVGLLTRQTASARSDVASASATLNRYFDPAARRTQAAATQLQQLQAQLQTVDLPPIEESLAVLATVGGPR